MLRAQYIRCSRLLIAVFGVCCMDILSDYQPGNTAPVAPSAIAVGDGFEVYTDKVSDGVHQ
jgi:hypothetical protein